MVVGLRRRTSAPEVLAERVRTRGHTVVLARDGLRGGGRSDGDEGEDGECEGSRWLRRAPALPGPNDLFGLIDAILLTRLSHGARCDASIRIAARLVRDL